MTAAEKAINYFNSLSGDEKQKSLLEGLLNLAERVTEVLDPEDYPAICRDAALLIEFNKLLTQP